MFNKLIIVISVLFLSSFLSFSQYQKFADSYGILSTVAGQGETDAGTVEWQPDFEGGLAINAELARPHFAMADTAGNIYIADKESHGIRKVNTDGMIQTFAGTNVAGDNGDGIATECQLNNPNGLWVREDGTVYILDLGNNKIRRVNTDGMLETIVDDDNGISLGRGLWVSKNEDSIFYANASKIKLWTANKGIEDYATGFSGIGNIVQDKNGYLVVTARSANRVYRISKDGLSKEVIAGNGSGTGGGDGMLATETGIEGVRGVWFLDDNTYFLATHEGSQIWYVDYQGIIHLFLNGEDDDDSHFGDGDNYNTPGYKISEARSVSVDYDGNLIICENDMGFIRKIENKYTYYYTSLFSKKENAITLNAYPNPAKNYVQIQFELPKPQNAVILIYNSIGEQVKCVHIGQQKSGKKSIELNVSDLENGVYFFTLKTSLETISKQLFVSRLN
ncbi:MAG: T9SS type A sorting domain-containing protein [Salinivirgaceae bacterium]|jgi:hypothetical protein|nr:T9SS type A sorting domain-containing protein [Salinivirgaceae bacterium]